MAPLFPLIEHFARLIENVPIKLLNPLLFKKFDIDDSIKRKIRNEIFEKTEEQNSLFTRIKEQEIKPEDNHLSFYVTGKQRKNSKLTSNNEKLNNTIQKIERLLQVMAENTLESRLLRTYAKQYISNDRSLPMDLIPESFSKKEIQNLNDLLEQYVSTHLKDTEIQMYKDVFNDKSHSEYLSELLNKNKLTFTQFIKIITGKDGSENSLNNLKEECGELVTLLNSEISKKFLEKQKSKDILNKEIDETKQIYKFMRSLLKYHLYRFSKQVVFDENKDVNEKKVKGKIQGLINNDLNAYLIKFLTNKDYKNDKINKLLNEKQEFEVKLEQLSNNNNDEELKKEKLKLNKFKNTLSREIISSKRQTYKEEIKKASEYTYHLTKTKKNNENAQVINDEFSKVFDKLLKEKKSEALAFLLNLNEEQAKHTSARFQNLFVCYSIFIKRVLQLLSKIDDESTQKGILKIIASMIKHSHYSKSSKSSNLEKKTSDKYYREIQGKEKEDEKELSIKEQDRIMRLTALLFKKKIRNKDFKNRQDAHTIPFPAMFSWNREKLISKVNKVFNSQIKNRQPNQEDRENLISSQAFFQSQEDPDLFDATLEELKEKFADNQPQFLFEALNLIAKLSLITASETEKLPAFINQQIDGISEKFTASIPSGDPPKRTNYRQDLAKIMKKLVKSLNKSNEESEKVIEIIKANQPYLDKISIAIKNQIKEIIDKKEVDLKDILMMTMILNVLTSLDSIYPEASNKIDWEKFQKWSDKVFQEENDKMTQIG